MNQSKSSTAAITFILLSAMLVGCAEPTPTPIPSPIPAPTPTPSAQEIVDGIIESFDNIRTYQLDMDWTVDMTLADEGKATFSLGYNGTVDFENRQMRIETTNESIAETGQPEMVRETEIYFIDGFCT